MPGTTVDDIQKTLEVILLPDLTADDPLSHTNPDRLIQWCGARSLPSSGRDITIFVRIDLEMQKGGSLWLLVHYLIEAQSFRKGAGWYKDYQLSEKVAARRFSLQELHIDRWVERQLQQAVWLAFSKLDFVDQELVKQGFKVAQPV